jgi:WD40 repeat protein
VGTVEGTIEIINTHSRKGVTTIQGEKGAVRALSFSSEEKNLLSLQGDGSLMSWDLKNRQQRYRILEDDRFIMKIAVSPKGLLATVDSDERVTLRSVFTGRRIMRLNVEKAQSLTFSPDGMTLFVGLDNRELRAVTLDHLSK